MITTLKRIGGMGALFLSFASLCLADPPLPATTAPPFHVAGSVTTADGKPAAGAAIAVYAYDFSKDAQAGLWRGQTDAAGSFDATLDGGVGPYVRYAAIYASSPDGVAVTSTVRENKAPVKIALQPPTRLTIHVVDAAGKPIAGAHLAPDRFSGPNRLFAVWKPGFAPDWSATTDSAGQATFDNMPGGDTVHLDAADAPYAHVLSNVRFPVGDAGAATTPATVLTLVPAETISGTVTYSGGPTAQPAATCYVGAQADTGGDTLGARADAEGHFRIERAPAGRYRLHAYTPGRDRADWAEPERIVTVLAGQDLTGQTLVFVHGGLIQGCVTDPTTAKPVSGIQIQVYRPSGPGSGFALTGPDGRYSIRMAPGTYSVAAYTAPVMTAQPPAVIVTEGGVAVQNFQVAQPPTPFTAHGIALGSDGKPAAGATVWLIGVAGPPATATTDASGKFAFDQDAATVQSRLYARLGDLATAQTVTPVNGKDITLTLSPGVLHGVRALVTDSQGKPIAGASVTVFQQRPGGSGFSVATGATDAAGRYTFQPAVSGFQYMLAASAAGYTNVFSGTIDVRAGALTDAPRISLIKADSFVGGTVVDPSGKPVAGANVTCMQTTSDMMAAQSVTDANGRFHIGGVPPGSVVLSVRAPEGRLASIQVPSGVDNDVIHVASEQENIAAGKRFEAKLDADPTNHGDGRDAHVVLAEAEQRAATTNRKLLLIFHASWCGPCFMLHRLLDGPQVKSVMDAHFVVQEIDVWEHDPDKKKAWENPGGDTIYRHYNGGTDNSGVPYFVVLDAHGRMIGDSKRNGQNMGMPEEPGEVDYFIALLKRADPRFSAADEAAVRDGVKRTIAATAS